MTNANPPLMHKTSFEVQNVENLLSTANISFIRVIVKPWSSNANRNIFVMIACDSDGNDITELEGDFPCPQNCIPPDTMIPPNNTFDLDDLGAVLRKDGIKFVNVHFSKRPEFGGLMDTESIYAVTGTEGDWKAWTDDGDPIYISETTAL